ncbi:MAG: metallophosphoesterase [Nitrospirae bacterium]|nr:metallophosphoesterase [Nitrospirota bacterium]
MKLFILAFILIYASMHLYALRAASAAIAIAPGVKAAIALVMLILIFTPFNIRYAESTGHEFVAIVAAYIGYYWMALLLYLVLSLFTFDIYRLVVFLAAYVSRSDVERMGPLKVSSAASFYISIIFSVCVCVYGYFEARAIRVEKVAIRTNKVSVPVKIAQISDVHIGTIIRDKRLKDIAAAIARENPDLLFVTGDLVDGQPDNINNLARYLDAVKAPSGKYAVTGNHEFYAGLNKSLEFIRQCGFRILRNEAADIGNSVVIAGVDDPEVSRNSRPHNKSEKELLMGIPQDKYTILLKHRPDVGEEGLFDLQLSGHTHKGQFFPFNIITWMYHSKHSGLVKLNERGFLYVNRGVGTWGPPIRVLSPPEITIIELIPENMGK